MNERGMILKPFAHFITACRQLSTRGWPWTRRCVGVSMGFGLICGMLDALALRWLDTGSADEPAPLPALASLVSGVGATAAAYALIGLVYGIVTVPVARAAKGRWAAAAGIGGLLAGAMLANLVSAVLCLYSGSYLTFGALQFTINSLSHVSGAAVSGHGMALAGIAVFSLIAWATLTCAVAARQSPRPMGFVNKRWVYAPLMLPSFVAAVRWDDFDIPHFEHEVWQATPELAFYSSLDAVTGLSEPAPIERATSPGPQRATEVLWDAAVHPPDHPPNVLLVMLESVSTRYVGFLGSNAGVTPHLDELARRGLVMRRTWSTATHSNYAQMAVLSSLFPRRGRGLDTYRNLDYPRFLLHDAFSRLGYATATISSQDESWQGMARFQDTGTPTHYRDARSHEGPRLDIGSERVVPDGDTTSKAIDWLERLDGPWALYVNYQSTHFPYRIPPEADRPFQPDTPTPETFDYLRYPERDTQAAINRYKNALAYVDAQIGRLARALKVAGQLDDTLWVITSDHGELFHEHGLVTHGRTLFEGESRVPLVLHWPAKIEPAISDIPTSTLNVLPTLLRSIGIAPHPSHQGSSILEDGKPVDAKRAILLNIQGLRSVEGVVCWPLKLVRDVASGTVKLFDLHSDPEEKVDLSNVRVEQRRQLFALLRGVMSEQDSYHRNTRGQISARFAPRIPRCPN